jgi:hypothetical protein
MSFMDTDLARSGLVATDLSSIETPNPFAPTTSQYKIPYWLPDGTPHPFMYRERLEIPRPDRGKYNQPSKEQAIAAGRPETDTTYPYLNPFILQRRFTSVQTGLTWAQVRAIPPPHGDGKLFCLTEGEKKAVAVGLFCARLAIGIGGCYNGVVRAWDGSFDVHPALLEIIQAGDRVEVVFDADMRTNRNVEQAAGSLRRALVRRGIRVSFVVVPPTVKGIDDWLMAHSVQQRVAAYESLQRLTFDRGELQEDRPSLIAYLDLPTNDDALITNEAAAGRVLDMHERYKDRIWIEDSEDMMYETVTSDTPQPVTDAFIDKQPKWFQAHINHSFSPAKIKNAFAALAADQHRHRNAIHAYVDSLKWDGVDRLESMFVRGWGAVDDPYTRAIGKAWLVGLVARVYRPGCDMQTMLILEGKQGIGKSRSLKALGGRWYVETTDKMDNKDFLLAAHRSLIFDLAELGAYKYADFAFVKGLLSTAVDLIRAPYGRKAEVKPRRFIIVGTTNEDLYLRDLTGNRRFWPIACGNKVDIDWIEANRDQLFAEAKVRLDAGAEWWVDDSLTLAVLDARIARDPWEDAIETVLLDVQRGAALVLNNVPYHFAPSEVLLRAVSSGNNSSPNYARLHGLMKKMFPEWEPYHYVNPLKPINVGGVMKPSSRGFRIPVSIAQTVVTPIDAATVTILNSKPLGESNDSASPPDNPFIVGP